VRLSYSRSVIAARWAGARDPPFWTFPTAVDWERSSHIMVNLLDIVSVQFDACLVVLDDDVGEIKLR
jgi:hypothetical protein